MISVVIPVYNSAPTLVALVAGIREVLKDDYEIILVNDGSVDESLLILKRISNEFKQIKIVNLMKNFGQHNAIMAGLNHVKGEYVLCMDDDLQNPAEEMLTLYGCIVNSSHDVVYGVYREKKHSSIRNLYSKMNDRMSNLLINKNKSLQVTSFFIMKKCVVDEIVKYRQPYPYLSGLILRITNNIGMVEVTHRERKTGKSNYSFRKLVALWANGFTNFSVIPLRASTFLGTIFSLAAFVFMLTIVINKLLHADYPSGWPSLICGIIFFGGIQLISIGIVGEYVGRMFLCINEHPQYVVRELIDYGGSDEDAQPK